MYGGLAVLLSLLAITVSAIVAAAYIGLSSGITVTASMAFAMGFGTVCQLVSDPFSLACIVVSFMIAM